MKKLLNRIETSATSASVQLQSSNVLTNNGGISGSGQGHGGGGPGSTNSSNSSGGSAQSNVLGKTISLKKVTNISVDEIIAEGGFGIVYLAKANSIKYALKRVVVNNDVDLNVVTREIQIMTTLSHPNLLPCIDFMVTPLGNSVTEALLLMPYYRSTLLSLLNQRMSAKSHMSEKEVLLILLDIVSAIARLHHCTTPIIHRDIKIENVLIDEAPAATSAATTTTSASSGPAETINRFVLCDFGSATAKVWDPQVNSIQTIQDDLEKYTTLAYRAPEMVDLYSNRGTLNTKLDIWALGIFTYKVCFYTTPFGDSVLAIQSANLTFPSSTTYSQQLHALIYYLLTPDSTQRPDIYQTGELVSQLLKIKNPIQNLNGSQMPPSFDVLISNMSTRKQSNDAVIINKASSAAIPLETSVTPRQRPKGNTILTAPTNGNILIIPPPKSPCKLQPDPPPGSEGDGRISHHRRNVSDSSAFEKSQLQPNAELCSATATSEQAISSWNPFEEQLTANMASATIAPIPPPPSAVVTTTAEPTLAVAAPAAAEDDDPFENAPFEFYKYQPIDLSQEDEDESDTTVSRFGDHSPVDLFGAAPFSNPFLQFQLGGSNGIPPPPRPTSSTTTDSLDSKAQFLQHSLQNPTTQKSQSQVPAQANRPAKKAKGTGVTNLSYED